MTQLATNRARRIIKYKELAEKNKSISDAMHNRVKQMCEVLQGEPVKRGHHSEKRHRKHLQIMEKYMDKSLEAEQKAKYFESKVNAAENNTAISSDDAQAIEKLQTKLSELETNHLRMKAINKLIRNTKISHEEKSDKLKTYFGYSVFDALQLLTNQDFSGQIGFPDYSLKNNLGAITATRARIKKLEQNKKIEDQQLIIGNIHISIRQDINRICMTFEDKPEEKIRIMLKAKGFRFAPSIGAWIKKIGASNIQQAKELATLISQGNS